MWHSTGWDAGPEPVQPLNRIGWVGENPMRENSEEPPANDRRLEAAEWFVEFDGGDPFARARQEDWLEWSSRPANQHSYEEVAQVCISLRALPRPRDATGEELRRWPPPEQIDSGRQASG